jgi:hypothetical protein
LPYQRVRLAWVSHNWGKDQSYVFSSSVLAQSIPRFSSPDYGENNRFNGFFLTVVTGRSFCEV